MKKNENENENTKINICGYFTNCLYFLLLFNPIYYLLYNEDINYIGFIYINLTIYSIFILYFNFYKILKYKYLDNTYFTNIIIYSQILILLCLLQIFLIYKFTF